MVLRIFTISATSDFLAALECTKNRYRQGLRPGPHWGKLTALPRPTGWFLRGRKGEEEGGKEGDVRDRPPFRKFLYPSLVNMMS